MANSERINMLLRLLENEPGDLFLNYALGLEHMALAELPQAESRFIKVLDLDPEYIPAYYQLGKLFESRSLNTEALHYFKLGLIKAREQNNNKARNEFEEAIFMLED